MLFRCRKYYSFISSICLLLFSTAHLSAQKVISVQKGTDAQTIQAGQLRWLIDEGGAKTFKQLNLNSFVEFTSINLEKTNKQVAIWSHMQLVNNSGLDQELILQTGKWGFFEVFIQSNANEESYERSGSLVQLHQRSQPANTNAIRFFLKRDEKISLYIRFRPVYSIYTHKEISLQLTQRSVFEKNDRQRLLWQGLFFGIILVMALYNLFILVAVKDISYFYYVLSIVSIGLYFAFYYGFGIEYLWPRSPLWDTFCFTIINPFTGLTRILFTRTYLHTPKLLPKINKLLNGLAAACILTMVTGYGCYLFNIDLLKPMVMIIAVLGALVLIMMLVAGIIAYYFDKYDPAKYFIAANILLVIGAIAFILRETGLMNDNFKFHCLYSLHSYCSRFGYAFVAA